MNLTVTIPIRTKSELNQREHWSKRHKRLSGHRKTVAMVLRSKAFVSLASFSSFVVTLTRIAPRELDDDNLRGAIKGCRDGVADFLGLDDRDPRVRWEYGQRRGRVREYAVEVNVVGFS